MSCIKLRYMNGFVGRDGRVRYYFRRRGCKALPLPGLPGSDEFMAAYSAALAGLPDPIEVGASRTLPGTVSALVVSYFSSDAWRSLGEDTKNSRRRIIDRFREQHGQKRVALMQREHFLAMLDKFEKPTTKRNWFKTIRALMKAAVPSMRKDDPTDGIPMPKLRKSKGHHTWTDDEIAKYRAHWPLGTQQRLVFEFALETTSRRSEVVRLGPQHVRNGRIRIERTHGSADVDIPISGDLQAACDAMPIKHLTYIVTAAGKPRSKFGLGNDFAEWATAAGLPSRCRMHGLKKGGMRRLAERGATTHELMAISGHKTLTEVQRYTADVDRIRLADSGMARLRDHSANGNATNSATRLHKRVKKPA